MRCSAKKTDQRRSQLLAQLKGVLRVQRLRRDILQQQKALIAMVAYAVDRRHAYALGARQQRQLIGFPREKGEHLAAVALHKNVMLAIAQAPGGMNVAAGKLVAFGNFGMAKLFA